MEATLKIPSGYEDSLKFRFLKGVIYTKDLMLRLIRNYEYDIDLDTFVRIR
mgnify:CR=1 FL=1